MRERLDLVAPEKTGKERKAGAVFGNEAVEAFGGRRDAGNVLIEPEGPTLAGRNRECAEDRFGSGVDASVGVDELHRLLALLTSQFGKTRCDGWVLEGDVLNTVTGVLLPPRNPTAAEIAVAVED